MSAITIIVLRFQTSLCEMSGRIGTIVASKSKSYLASVKALVNPIATTKRPNVAHPNVKARVKIESFSKEKKSVFPCRVEELPGSVAILS